MYYDARAYDVISVGKDIPGLYKYFPINTINEEDTDIISSLYGHIHCHQEPLQYYLEGYYLST